MLPLSNTSKAVSSAFSLSQGQITRLPTCPHGPLRHPYSSAHLVSHLAPQLLKCRFSLQNILVPKDQLFAPLHTFALLPRTQVWMGEGAEKSFYLFISCYCLQPKNLQKCPAVCFRARGDGVSVYQSQEVRRKVCSDPEGENAGLRNQIPPSTSQSSSWNPQCPYELPHFGPNWFLMPYPMSKLWYSWISHRHHISLLTGKEVLSEREQQNTLDKELIGTWVFYNPNDKLAQIIFPQQHINDWEDERRQINRSRQLTLLRFRTLGGRALFISVAQGSSNSS